MLGYAYSPGVLAHDPPAPTLEVSGRPFALGTANVAQAALTAQAHELVERSALGGRLVRIDPEPAPEQALLAVHTEEYLTRFREACAGGPWDGEHAPVTPATWDAARLTVGGVLAAVDAVLDDRVPRALVHARPAGHHAEPDRAIASTYLNNLACGVEHARARGVGRVAIVDWDVHVGNGAERIFAERDEVLAISLHQQDWYPAHAGDVRATGGRGAEGCTVNVPLPPATTDAGYLLAFDELVAPVVRAFRPDLILIAAGQDASVLDPTGRMLVSAAGFRALAGRAARLADELTGGRLVASTEGGYSPLYNPFCAAPLVLSQPRSSSRTRAMRGLSSPGRAAPPAPRPPRSPAPDHTRVRFEEMTPVSKPARCRPPAKRACSIFRQRFVTTSSPAPWAIATASSECRPSCAQKTFAPMATASSATPGSAAGGRNASTTSGTPGSSCSDVYAFSPRTSPPFGVTGHSSKSAEPERR